MIQSPQRWLSFRGRLNIIPQHVHSGSEMAVNAFTHSWQHNALSHRWACGNRSLNSATVWVTRSIAGWADAGRKRRRQTRHLGGKIVSSKVCQMDFNPTETAFLALVSRCTTAASFLRFDSLMTDFHQPSAAGRFHTSQLLRPPMHSTIQGSRAAGWTPKNRIFF